MSLGLGVMLAHLWVCFWDIKRTAHGLLSLFVRPCTKIGEFSKQAKPDTNHEPECRNTNTQKHSQKHSRIHPQQQSLTHVKIHSQRYPKHALVDGYYVTSWCSRHSHLLGSQYSFKDRMFSNDPKMTLGVLCLLFNRRGVHWSCLY